MLNKVMFDNMFINSNERLDLIEKREQFLKNTFESLGGTESDFQDDKYHFPSTFGCFLVIVLLYFYIDYLFLGKRSISSQYKGNNNVSLVQQNTNSETLNRRVELQQRIEETRRMLQNVCFYFLK